MQRMPDAHPIVSHSCSLDEPTQSARKLITRDLCWAARMIRLTLKGGLLEKGTSSAGQRGQPTFGRWWHVGIGRHHPRHSANDDRKYRMGQSRFGLADALPRKERELRQEMLAMASVSRCASPPIFTTSFSAAATRCR